MESLLMIDEGKLFILSLIAILYFIKILKFNKLEKKEAKTALFTFITFVISLSLLYYLKTFFNPSHLFNIITILFSISYIFIHKKTDTYKEKQSVFFVLLNIIITYICFISYGDVGFCQHDCRSFFDYKNQGHLGYMGYLFYERRLPPGNPINFWCGFNPPLHYFLSVAFLRINDFLSIPAEAWLKNLQILPCIYTSIFIIYVYKIFNNVGLKKTLLTNVLFIGFAPIIIIFSGSLNNDILSIMLSTIALYYAIKWYETDKLKTLINIAIAIGLAMMTKVSSALIAVVIAVIFLIKVIKNRKDFKRYVWQFTLFAVVALPLGLWFPIRNLVLYNISPTYVQAVPQPPHERMVEANLFERLFTFEKQDIESINVNVEGDSPEYSILITSLKSFIIDENINYNEQKVLNIVVPMLFYVAFWIAILFIINLIYTIINHKKINNMWLYIFMLLFILQIISYISFCLEHPYPFTAHIRYIIPTLLSFGVITGLAADNNKILYHINKVTLLTFTILSILMFTNLIK